MRLAPAPPARDRPVVLLILQGPHHLDLFRSLLTRCRGLSWACLIHDRDRIPQSTLDALWRDHGVRVLADRDTAMLHMGDVDAVVTTYAIPDAAHLPYLGLSALASELGVPVFELQHGLFQSGISFHADAPVIGTGRANGLPLRNLTDARLTWWGTDAVGYPPFVAEADDYLPDPAGTEPVSTPPRAPAVAVLTNLHWTVLSPAEAAAGYGMIRAAVLALPDVDFALAPHPTEAASTGFIRMQDCLTQAGARNVTLVPATDRAGRGALMRTTPLALASASSVLLDLEMRNIPTLLLGLPALRPLYDTLDRHTRADTAAALVAGIADALDGTTRPVLRSGRLVPFDPAALERRIRDATPPDRLPARTVLPILHRYLRPR